MNIALSAEKNRSIDLGNRLASMEKELRSRLMCWEVSWQVREEKPILIFPLWTQESRMNMLIGKKVMFYY